MDYQELIKTLSAIVENDDIVKKGLTLVYELEPKKHRQMHEQLFYSNPDNTNAELEPVDVFELEYSDIIVKFIKNAKNGDN